MFRRLRLPHIAACFVGVALCGAPITARAAQAPSFVNGSIVLYCQPGTPQATVNAIAARVNGTVTPLLLADCYKLVLPVAQADSADTLNAVATLKTDPNVRFVSPDTLYKTTASSAASVTPNDPLYPTQWGLPQINMPQAWVLQKGSANCADIDQGFDITHPDLIGQYLADSFNFVNNSNNVAPSGPDPENQHGVSTSSIIDALTNNGVGMSSVCGWGTTKVLGCKAGTGGFFTITDLINAQNYVLQKATADNIVACNESYGGGGDPTNTADPMYVSTQLLTQAGVIVVAAAGNSTADDHTSTPAGYVFPNLLTVAALNRNSQPTYYTDFGKIDISAPGGEQFSNNDPNGLVVAVNGSYAFEQGTSFAAPMVTGVVTLLRSIVGVTPAKAISLIETTANHTATGQSTVPDTRFGYGDVDAYAALLPVSFTASVISPLGLNAAGQTTDPTGAAPPAIETLKPTLEFQVSNIPIANVNVSIINSDSTTTPILSAGVPVAAVTNFVVTGDQSGLNGPYTISLRYPFSAPLATQNVTVQITAQPTDTTIAPVVDTRTFTIQPHSFNGGLNFVAFPYNETAADSPSGTVRSIGQVLSATDTVLYRYVPQLLPGNLSPYAVGGGATNLVLPTEASLDSPSINQNRPADLGPVGVGYWMQTTASTRFTTDGTDYSTQTVDVPLHEGWNMVGDPFPFAVGFGSVQFQTPSGNLLTAANAAAQGVILPYVYTYAGGQYQFSQLPGGSFLPWQGAWIYVVPGTVGSIAQTSNALTMIVPPAGSLEGSSFSRAAAGTVTSTPAPMWTLNIQGVRRGVPATGVTIGLGHVNVGSRSAGAPVPPMVGHYVEVASIPDTTTGLQYMQDIRSASGTQTWKLNVSTDASTGAPVTISWPGIVHVPRSYSITLTDPSTGAVVDMRRNSSYQVAMPVGTTTRALTVAVSPDPTMGRAVLSGLSINELASARGTSGNTYDIAYNISRSAQVTVSVVGLNGGNLGDISSTRAASVGTNHVTWNAADGSGRILPAGVYTVVVRAVTSSGQVSRVTYPVTLTGR